MYYLNGILLHLLHESQINEIIWEWRENLLNFGWFKYSVIIYDSQTMPTGVVITIYLNIKGWNWILGKKFKFRIEFVGYYRGNNTNIAHINQ